MLVKGVSCVEVTRFVLFCFVCLCVLYLPDFQQQKKKYILKLPSIVPPLGRKSTFTSERETFRELSHSFSLSCTDNLKWLTNSEKPEQIAACHESRLQHGVLLCAWTLRHSDPLTHPRASGRSGQHWGENHAGSEYHHSSSCNLLVTVGVKHTPRLKMCVCLVYMTHHDDAARSDLLHLVSTSGF